MAKKLRGFVGATPANTVVATIITSTANKGEVSPFIVLVEENMRSDQWLIPPAKRNKKENLQ